MSIKQHVRILFKNPLFKDFSVLERLQLLSLCHRRTYRSGETIFHEGDPGNGVYFIEQGRVDLTSGQRASKGGTPESRSAFVTAHLEEADAFGFLTPGSDLRRHSSARCVTDCTLFGFFKQDYDTLLKRHPRLAAKLLDGLNSRLMASNDALLSALTECLPDQDSSLLLIEAIRRERVSPESA